MRHPFLLASVVTLALTAAGCAGFSVPFVGGTSDIIRATAANPVMDVITLWEPGEGRGLDNLPSRGVAGQLMFFTYWDPSPALVEGNVTIYLFDDQGSEAEQSRPLWQRTFTPAEWNSFARQTSLGTAYQLFVPYVRKGPHEAHCSVRVKFEPADGGPPVYSKMADMTLPGANSERPKSTLRHERIAPKRLDPELVNDLRSQPQQQAEPARSSLQSTTLTLPRQRRVSPDATARLQQLAQEMVRDQQEPGGIQQVGYATDAVSSSDVDEAAEPVSGGRYRLYR